MGGSGSGLVIGLLEQGFRCERSASRRVPASDRDSDFRWGQRSRERLIALTGYPSLAFEIHLTAAGRKPLHPLLPIQRLTPYA